MSAPTEQFGEVIGAIVTALRLLGGDAAIQAAVGSWHDGQDDATTLSAINDWVETERGRIVTVIRVFNETAYWEPGKQLCGTSTG